MPTEEVPDGLPDGGRAGPPPVAPPGAHNARGVSLQALGRHDEAGEAFARELEVSPGDPAALNNLAVSLCLRGRPAEALPHLLLALGSDPDDPETLCNLAAALRSDGRRAEALPHLRRALALRPGLAAAHFNLGNALLDAGDLAEAAESFGRAAALDPAMTAALVGRGRALLLLGRLPEAERDLRRAREASPRDAEAALGLGMVHQAAGQHDASAAWLREALALRPGWPEALDALGTTLQAARDYDGAVAAYGDALRARPGWTVPRYNLGVALQARGELAGARACYEAVLRDRPGDSVALGTYAGAALYDPDADAASVRAAHAEWGRRHEPAGPPPEFGNDPDPARRLRVGYVSPDFRDHAVAAFLGPALAHRDRREVEVIAYASVPAPDARTAGLRGLCDAWRDVAGLDDRGLAGLVRADEIDVLVDLAGHTAGGRPGLFALRPAPVQVGYLGYPAWPGLSALPYRVSDAVADPPGTDVPGDEAVRLPGCFCAYEPPAHAPAVVPPPCLAGGPVTFGSLHKLEKLNGSVLDLWSRLLAAVPDSCLLVARDALRGRAADRLRAEFFRRGVGPDRVVLEEVWAVGGRHWRLYGRVDIALDVFPWNGHTLACEALWSGVPVVTLAGDRFAARMAASVLHAAGTPQWVAATPGEYLRVAAGLAADRRALAALRAGLRERVRASRLCDGPALARDLNDAFRGLWRRWCAGTRDA